jgi:tetratricopeptide (TPR) repeat protein
MKKYRYTKDPLEYYNNGLQKYEYKDFKGAISDFTLALEYKKDFYEAYFMRGLIYGKEIHKYKKAIKDFTKAIKIKPDYGEAYFNIGVTYRVLDDVPKACVNWKKAEELGFEGATDLIRKYCMS